jgi:hypothetical protein
VCNTLGCDPCHIQTFAVTLADLESNLIPLCRKHHSEQHQTGIVSFLEKYPIALEHVKTLGFEIVDLFGQKKLRKK